MEGFRTKAPGARAFRILLLIPLTLAVSLLMLIPVGRGDAATAYDAEEQQFLRLINGYRQENGLRPLALSDTLTLASERHSKDMAAYGFFAHNTEQSAHYPEGARPWDRMEAEGYDYNTAKGENLAVGYETAEEAMEAWQESSSHNAAMLDGDYKVIGISRINVPGSVHGWYWTTDFGGVVEGSSRPENRKAPEPADTPQPPGESAQRPAEQPETSSPPRPPAEPDDRPAADSGAVENGALGAEGVWKQGARDGSDLIMEEGYARLGGYHDGEDELRQRVRIGRDATLAYDVKVKTGTQSRDDQLLVRLTDGRGRQLAVLERYTGEDETGWSRERVDLSRFAGRRVFLSFHAKTDAERLTAFYVDDVSLDR